MTMTMLHKYALRLGQHGRFRGFYHRARPAPIILSPDVKIEEEKDPGYVYKRFFAANPGDLLGSQYKLISKLGCGTTSTVWLAEDKRKKRKEYVAVKITIANLAKEAAAVHELEMSKLLSACPSHNGFDVMRTMLDNFKIQGPDGAHTCLVYEPLREPLWVFQRRLPNNRFPLPLLKAYLSYLLEGLDYLHSKCHLVHTDLKADNILLGFGRPAVLQEYVEEQTSNPIPRKVTTGGPIYLSNNNFGDLRSHILMPKITDFGLAQRGDGPLLRFPIQPQPYHAPEVLLGTGWSYSADIWNLGVLIWNMLERRYLFPYSTITNPMGEHDARVHLAQLIAFLGRPPKELLDRERLSRNIKWKDDCFLGKNGKPCFTACEYFGGPFFNDDGKFMYEELILKDVILKGTSTSPRGDFLEDDYSFIHTNIAPKDFNLESTVTSLEGDEKEGFLNFVRKMLRWLPEERSTAKELLDDPWLTLGRKDSDDLRPLCRSTPVLPDLTSDQIRKRRTEAFRHLNAYLKASDS